MKKSIKGAGGSKHSQSDIKAPAKKMPTTKDSKHKKGKKSVKKFNAGAFAKAKASHFGVK